MASLHKLSGFVKKNWWFLIGPLVVSLEILLVYFIKGVYPFGDRTVSYYDMAQSIIPHYYHGYDVLHLNKNLYLDWNVSLGTTIVTDVGRFVLFPINIFLLFINRDSIIQNMSFFVILKMSLASLFMEIYCFYKKNNKFLSVIFSISYALCGMAIQYYSTLVMLDDILLFPLIVYSFYQLLNNDKKMLYVVCMYFVFTFNPHTIFFVCYFLLMYTFIETKSLKSDERNKFIFKILICSVISFLCASYVLIPNLIQLSHSSRIGQIKFGLIDVLKCVVSEYQGQKNFILFTSEYVFPLILVILLCKKFKKYFWNILLVILLLVPIFYESVDMMWHLGTYESFPMRFGFILTFSCIDLLLITWDDIKFENKYVNKVFPLFSISFLPLVVIVIYKICSYFLIYGIIDCELYINYWMIIIGLFIFYFGIFVCNEYKLKVILITIMVLCQTFLGAYGFIAPESDLYAESSSSYIYTIYEKNEEFEGISGINNRIKDSNFELNANYSFISQTASSSGWVSGTQESVVLEKIRMGYDQIYLRTLDCGGTALTDFCLSYKYNYNSNSEKSDLYESIEGKDDLYLLKYSNDFGYIIYNDSLIDKTVGFQHQNEIFNALGGEGMLFDVFDVNNIEFDFDENEQDYYLEFEYYSDKDNELYIYADPSSEYDYEIYINDELICVPYLFVKDNKYYPCFDRNGILDCGTFENETVKITLRSYSTSLGDDIEIASMSLDKFRTFIDLKEKESYISDFEQKKGSLSMTVVSKFDGDYILPIGYSDNWIIKVNGDIVDYSGAFNNALLSIPIKEGTNDIIVLFHQKGLYLGIALSVIGVLLAIIFIIVKSKWSFNNSSLNKVLYYVYLTVLIGLLVMGYILPIIMSTIVLISGGITPWYVLTFSR